MPSSFLSPSEQARLNRFPEQIPHEDLITFFTLSEKDTTAVAKQRGSTNRLGFALQLCALRYLGFAPDDLSTTPWDAVEFVAQQLSRAVAFGHNQDFLYGEKVEQEIAEGCRRLIKNAIICWNYLYLSQRIREEKDEVRRQALLSAVQNGSVVSWRHINLHGEYDFSEERLQDSVGIRWPTAHSLRSLTNGKDDSSLAPS